MGDLTVDEMLNKIESEVKRYRESCFEDIPIQIEQARNKIEQIRELTSGIDVGRSLRSVEQDNIRLKQSINELMEKINKAKSEYVFSRLSLFFPVSDIMILKLTLGEGQRELTEEQRSSGDRLQ